MENKDHKPTKKVLKPSTTKKQVPNYPPEYNPELMFSLMESEVNERKKLESEVAWMRSHIELLTVENHKLHDEIKELRSYNNKLLFRKT